MYVVPGAVVIAVVTAVLTRVEAGKVEVICGNVDVTTAVVTAVLVAVVGGAVVV